MVPAKAMGGEGGEGDRPLTLQPNGTWPGTIKSCDSAEATLELRQLPSRPMLGAPSLKEVKYREQV